MIYAIVSEDLGGALLMFPLALPSIVDEQGEVVTPAPAELPLCFFDLEFAHAAAEQARTAAVNGAEDWKVCYFVRVASSEHIRPVRHEESVAVPTEPVPPH